MQVEILYRPAYSLGMIALSPNETVQVEGGSMVSMSPGVNVETKAAGGILKSLARSVLGGEGFFMNTFKAPNNGGQISVAPPLPGDLTVIELQNEKFMVQSGGYVASELGINIDTKWGGAKTFFASEGLIMLHCTGTGKLIVSSYGAIHEINLGAGQGITIDTGHLVAFTDGIGFKIRPIGGIKSTLFSGEGLVVDLTGPGKVYMQTRSMDAFLSWIIPKLPKTSSNHS
ncbi:MAG: TIGR00266 family protein [Chloroflexota bacterium]